MVLALQLAHWNRAGVVVFSEIYQVTGPVERFAGQIASQGYVHALPSTTNLKAQSPYLTILKVNCSLHWSTLSSRLNAPPETGTDRGNRYKIEKTVDAYDEVLHVPCDATLAIDLLSAHKNCNGRIAATGMCLGGHLAAFDPRVLASVCWFATDIHSATLGKGKQDDTLIRVKRGDLTGKGELVMIFGKQDTHVPREGRDLIRRSLEDANVTSSFIEVQAQHAFIRDESSKGRWDAALTRSLFTFMMEVFDRTVARDLGPRDHRTQAPEHSRQ
ncbi:carboxymethylenebutenolidase [Coprinopsis cinerea okayama7|uniref:Carboxymethylenebutenolidase n=1 Tax=Coprinopsis cinerea (strain Okayama-7 / 130 / ATCC MYA-4618 / FGSC 9003) TaxID=240176 RepID=A8N1H9_COPC7|nr:carboxymethylenebutenolidase [Coprinopsis cinerea okayama7\|eukprot:XP_001828759.2 carboxymethylenebutenolidase [Coprinopsis cinerea okayama7\